MKLTFPKSYTADQLQSLYDEYRNAKPELYAEWVSIERKGRDIELDDLHQIQQDLYDFLSERFDWDNHLALSEVFLDFRRQIVWEHLGYRLA